MHYRYRLGKRTYETAQTRAAFVLLLPTLAALAVLFLYPVIRVFVLSFTNTNTITNISVPNGWKNYEYLLKNAMFRKAFFNTWKFTLSKLVLEVVISLVLAVLLDEFVPCRKYLRMPICTRLLTGRPRRSSRKPHGRWRHWRKKRSRH